jgi:lipopolysaccharide export system protein LptA
MFHSTVQGRQWLIGIAITLIAIVSLSYLITRSRTRPTLHSIPQQLGLDIQQTSEGFSISKSEGGRTLYTVRASNAVQFKTGSRADLKNVHIVIYGKAHDRFDQIYGNEFVFDQDTGDITAAGEVHIDLQGYIEGPLRPDQAPPDELKNPVHLTTHALTFNQKTGIAQTDEVVEFRTLQASGTAKGAYLDSRANKLLLKSDIHIVTTGANASTITGTNGSIQKDPRQAVLENARIDQPDKTLTADQITMLFEPDNTVQHILAEGNVHIESRGPTIVDIVGPRGDLNMGPQNSAQQAIISGGAKFDTRGENLTHGGADTFILDFGNENQPSLFHMVKNAWMKQDPKPSRSETGGQPMRIDADQLDFKLENGNQVKTGDTTGKAQITIFPAPSGSRHPRNSDQKGQETATNATTVATAGRFHATFGDDNRMQTLHGSPESKIVSTSPGEPEKVSTSRDLDVTFAADGGVEKLVQTVDFTYHEPSPKPDTGGRAAFAEVATYTPNDQLLVLKGSPRVIDGGMTTTATTLRINRQTGDAFADDNVKTTYSDLKPQPNGALLATSDPIHVTAANMTARNRPGLAIYTGNVRLWQGANVVRAPKIDFDNTNRSMLAQGDPSHPVLSLFVQQGQDGKLTPVDVISNKLTYVDEQRRARYTGNVFAKTTTGTVSAEQIDIYLKPAEPSESNSARAQRPELPGSEGPSKIDHMVAIDRVIVTEPNRRAVGDRLVYTADDGKYYLTGRSPSIFDAEHGTVWGDSLTFYSHDDRVLVESKASSPTITRARTTK